MDRKKASTQSISVDGLLNDGKIIDFNERAYSVSSRGGITLVHHWDNTEKAYSYGTPILGVLPETLISGFTSLSTLPKDVLESSKVVRILDGYKPVLGDLKRTWGFNTDGFRKLEEQLYSSTSANRL